MKCRHKNKFLWGIGIVFLMLTFSSISVTAQFPTLMGFRGYVYIGDANATANTQVIVRNAATHEFLDDYNLTGDPTNYYSLDITISSSTNLTNDNIAYCGDPLEFTVKAPSWSTALIAYTPRSGYYKANCTGGSPDIRLGIDMNITHCIDGVKDRDELMTDCGGVYCTPCYALNVSPASEFETFTSVNTSQNFTLTVYNVGYHNITNITLSVPSNCNFTVNPSTTAISKMNGTYCGDCNSCDCSWNYITAVVNKTVGDIPSGTYYCNITFNSPNASYIVTVGITISSGVCDCDSCSNCTNSLDDNVNCDSGVRLTANIVDYSGTCINDPANFSNKTFDCQGYIIDGDDSGIDYGIYLTYKGNNIVKNCIITDFEGGIYLYDSSNNKITNSTANSNNYGFDLYSSSNNTLINSTANLNSYGIELYYSSNNTLTNNTANSNGYTGITLDTSSNNTLTNNTVNSNNRWAITLDTSSNNIIANNIINSNNYIGITLDSSNNNNIVNNSVNDNNQSGIYIFRNSSFNSILDNNILNNTQTGITLSNCYPWAPCSEGNSNNTLQGNEISNNGVGIYSNSTNSTINSNIVCNNTNLDFNSSDWMSSYGDNNRCDASDGWSDEGITGCTYACTSIPNNITYFNITLFQGWNLISIPLNLVILG